MGEVYRARDHETGAGRGDQDYRRWHSAPSPIASRASSAKPGCSPRSIIRTSALFTVSRSLPAARRLCWSSSKAKRWHDMLGKERRRGGGLPLHDVILIAKQIADGARGRARARDRPPRPETREHQDARRRAGQGARLRPGEGSWTRRRVDGAADVSLAGDGTERRLDSGNRRLHEPGAGSRAGRRTSGQTSGRSAASSTSCSRAAPHSPVRRCPTPLRAS